MMLQTLLISSARWTAIFWFFYNNNVSEDTGGTQELYAWENIVSKFISNYSCGT
jgi:hypothetical protein